eukprot:6464737-Amphidinium_carterae.1
MSCRVIRVLLVVLLNPRPRFETLRPREREIPHSFPRLLNLRPLDLLKPQRTAFIRTRYHYRCLRGTRGTAHLPYPFHREHHLTFPLKLI